jgi:hypothetical protein
MLALVYSFYVAQEVIQVIFSCLYQNQAYGDCPD